MKFMNSWEVESNATRYRTHPTLGPATQFLLLFMREVDEHSDGWPYWSPPVKAAENLITLIENGGNPTIEAVQRTLTPIKAFMTRRGRAAGMTMPDLQLTLPELRA